MSTVSMTSVDYEKLLAWAKTGSGGDAEFYDTRNRIDRGNSITRYTLMVRWQEVPAHHNPTPVPATYPELKTLTIQMTRPITRADVLKVLENKDTGAALIYVTADVTGRVGWYDLDNYPF